MGLFGNKKNGNNTWQELAEEIGAEYHAGAMGYDTITSKFDKWYITLGKYSRNTGKYPNTIQQDITYISAYFKPLEGFKFAISKKDIFSMIENFFKKLFGAKQIQLGDSEFDKRFIIRGSHPEKIKELFQDEAIKKLLRPLRAFDLSIKRHNTMMGMIPGADQMSPYLYYTTLSHLKDKELLKNLFLLFGSLLKKMDEIGVIQD